MESWQYRIIPVLLIGSTALALFGCHGAGQSDLLERELRILEDRNYCLEDQLCDVESRLDSCRRENATLREKLARDRAGGQEDIGERGDLRPPRTDLGLPSGADLPSARPMPVPLEEAPPFEGPPQISPPSPSLPEGMPPESPPLPEGMPTAPTSAPPAGPSSASANDYDAAKLTLNKMLTGGFNPHHQNGDEGIMVVVEPRNARGDILDTPGEVSIVVLDPAFEGAAGRVARWDFTADEAADHFKKNKMAEGLIFELPWPAEPPKHADLMLFVRFTQPGGTQLIADREIKVKLPLADAEAATADNWSATTEPGAEEVPAAEPTDAALEENAPATLEPAAAAPTEAPTRSAQRVAPRRAPARKN